MNTALELTSNEFGVDLIEFTVSGVPHGNYFAHHWYIGYDGNTLDAETVKQAIDKHLKILNDDYRVERSAALRDVIVDLIPNDIFIEWMKKNGKFGAQTKFPRVLKNEKLLDWKQFVKQSLTTNSQIS